MFAVHLLCLSGDRGSSLFVGWSLFFFFFFLFDAVGLLSMSGCCCSSSLSSEWSLYLPFLRRSWSFFHIGQVIAVLTLSPVVTVCLLCLLDGVASDRY